MESAPPRLPVVKTPCHPTGKQTTPGSGPSRRPSDSCPGTVGRTGFPRAQGPCSDTRRAPARRGSGGNPFCWTSPANSFALASHHGDDAGDDRESAFASADTPVDDVRDMTASERRITTLLRLFAVGKTARELAAPRAAAPPPQEVLEALRQPHPPDLIVDEFPLASPPSWLERKLVASVIRRSRCSAPGPDGWTREPPTPLLEQPQLVVELTELVSDMIDGKVSSCFAARVRASPVYAIDKGNGRAGSLRAAASGRAWSSVRTATAPPLVLVRGRGSIDDVRSALLPNPRGRHGAHPQRRVIARRRRLRRVLAPAALVAGDTCGGHARMRRGRVKRTSPAYAHAGRTACGPAGG